MKFETFKRGMLVFLFYIQIPHEKYLTRFLSSPSYAPFLSYVPLKTNFENIVCKISKKIFKLELSYLVY